MPQTQSPSAKKLHNREIAALASRLLNHYWTANDPVELRQAQLEDWIADLTEFDINIIAKACDEYRHGPDRRHRPLPGDIRELCVIATNRHREKLQLEDDRRKRWPQWLEDIWGPEPEGPRLRAEWGTS